MESRAVLVESDGIYCKNIEEAFSEVSVELNQLLAFTENRCPFLV